VPILVVPSINPHYLGEFIAALRDKCSLHVTMAEEGQVPDPGTVYVALTSPCLYVVQGCLRLERGDPDCWRHAKDTLFRSMARDQGSASVAVILTGMGSDGAAGMREVRDAGGHTIVQDRSTSFVYGTALSAERLNAACEFLPLQEIAPRLLELVAISSSGPKYARYPVYC